MNTKELETKRNEAQNKIADWAGSNLTAQQAKELFPLIAEVTRIQSQISVDVALDTVFQKLELKILTPNTQKTDTSRDNTLPIVPGIGNAGI